MECVGGDYAVLHCFSLSCAYHQVLGQEGGSVAVKGGEKVERGREERKGERKIHWCN